jgi:hypothetical protein
MNSSKDSKDAEEYSTRGHFTSIFGGPVARLLDQALIVGIMKQTVTILAESTNQSYKTTKTAYCKNSKKSVSFLQQEKSPTPKHTNSKSKTT